MKSPVVESEVESRSAENADGKIHQQKASDPIQGARASDNGRSGVLAGVYQHLQGYSFFVPDQWRIQSSRIGLKMEYSGRMMPTAKLDIRVLFGDLSQWEEAKAALARRPPESKEGGDDQSYWERIDTEQTSINGLDAIIHHYRISSTYGKIDIILGFFYKEGSVLYVKGDFISPTYAKLRKDIKAVLESVRKE